MAVHVPGQLLLAYAFTTLVLGTACIGSVLMLAWLRQDELARAFLWLYGALTVALLSTLLLALTEAQAAVSPGTISIEYLEAFVGRYGVMLALPLFAHRAFGIRDRRRDRRAGETRRRLSPAGRPLCWRFWWPVCRSRPTISSSLAIGACGFTLSGTAPSGWW